MPESQKHIETAIVGLGNILLTDDGVGVHAVRKLRQDAPEGIILAEVGTALLDALELLERVDVVLAIDAVQAGDAPGSLYCLDLADVEMQKDFSLHEFGIAAAVQSLPVKDRPSVTILGVEPAVIDYGTQLSPVLQAVLPQIVRTARTMTAPLTRTMGVKL